MNIEQLIKRYPLIIFMGLLFSCHQQKTSWDIRDFGAVADTITVNTSAIQKAIDTCSKAGGGTVIIQGGTFISGTILLKNNVTLKVAETAKLLGSSNPFDYTSIDPFVDATGQLRGKCLVGAIDVENIAITGKGTIDGQGDLFTTGKVRKTLAKLGLSAKEKQIVDTNTTGKEGKIRKFDRPFLLRLVRTKNITVQEIKLMNPAAWTFHLYQCANFNINGIKIYSHANSNNDGIDIDSSTDGVIENCDIDSGDDAICFKTTSPLPTENIRVENCRIKSEWGALKLGTESMGDFRNILVKNCLVHDTRGGGIKILSVDGAEISNIKIDSIRMENVDMPLFIRLGERLRTYRDAPQQHVGTIKDVSISNVTATTWGLKESRVSPPSGIFITGTPNHKIEEIKLRNISIHLPGGGTKLQASSIVEEQEKRYPEFNFFGVLPAYGIMARHIQNLTAENISFTLDTADQRHPVIFNDIDNPSIGQISTKNKQIKSTILIRYEK